MGNARSVVARRHGLTLMAVNPDAGPVVTGSAAEAAGGVAAAFDDVSSGRISLGILGTLVVLILAFYYWTRSVQGGG
jgi:hypothetical protein